MSTLQLPAYPTKINDPNHGPLTANFGSIFVELVNKAQSIVDSFAAVRDAKGKTEKVLESGTTAEAVEYRQRKASAETKLQSIRDDEKYAEDRATIKALQERIDNDIRERSNKVRDVLKTLKDAAVKAEIGEIVTDIDPAALAKQLTDVNTSLTGAKNLLIAEHPALKGWRPLGVGAVSGKSAEEKAWAPRLAGAQVNGTDVPFKGENVTMGDVARFAKIKDRDNLAKGLETHGCGGVRVLPSDTWTTFTLDVNGTDTTISVIGRAPKHGENEEENDDTDVAA